MTTLISSAKDKGDGISLAIVKPKRVIDFIWEPCEREWDKKKIDKVIANQAQGNLLDVEDTIEIFKVVRKLPYKFSYIFTTDDGIERTVMIEDWELGGFYWNCLKDTHDEKMACQKVKEKYYNYMFHERDLYFFMGSTLKFHNVAPNPLIIIGAFYPPKVNTVQLSLY